PQGPNRPLDTRECCVIYFESNALLKQYVPMQRIAVLTISCWSGFQFMGFEMLSGRILAPTFGSSIYVWGAIISVFMLTLSLVYLIGGRLSMRQPTLARLGLIHAVAGALILPVLFFEIPVLDGIFEITQDPRLGSLAA